MIVCGGLTISSKHSSFCISLCYSQCFGFALGQFLSWLQMTKAVIGIIGKHNGVLEEVRLLIVSFLKNEKPSYNFPSFSRMGHIPTLYQSPLTGMNYRARMDNLKIILVLLQNEEWLSGGQCYLLYSNWVDKAIDPVCPVIL